MDMSEMVPKKKKSFPALEDFPKELRMAIAKVMTRFNLDYPEALDRAAILLDVNSRVFEKEVNREADRRYKSMFMTQLNKARFTIEVNYEGKVEGAYWDGLHDGRKETKEEYAIWYHCYVCNEPIYIRPNSEPHRLVSEFLRSRRWGHSSCHEKSAVRR
jgi:hypothetical protein